MPVPVYYTELLHIFEYIIANIKSKFVIFCRLMSQQNMRDEKNIDHIVRKKRAITN